MRCECRGREHTVVVYGRIGAGSRSDHGKVPLAGLFIVKIEDALKYVGYDVKLKVASKCVLEGGIGSW